MKSAIEEISKLGFGTELELERITRKDAAEAIQSVVGGTIAQADIRHNNWTVTAPDGRVWKAVYDGSLGGTSAEVVTPILHLEDIETLQEVVRALRHAGAKATENCGLHIHVGAADFSATQIANLVRLFYKQETLILKAVGTLEHRLRYTAPTDREFIARLEALRNPTMRDLNKAWFEDYNPCPMHYDSHRYRAVNLNNLWVEKKTVEFRFFNSTTHAGEVKAYIHLALALAAKAKNAHRAFANQQRGFNFGTSKYEVRCFLLRLGFIGPEFFTSRKHLLKRLGGSTPWKGERRD